MHRRCPPSKAQHFRLNANCRKARLSLALLRICLCIYNGLVRCLLGKDSSWCLSQVALAICVPLTLHHNHFSQSSVCLSSFRKGRRERTLEWTYGVGCLVNFACKILKEEMLSIFVLCFSLRLSLFFAKFAPKFFCGHCWQQIWVRSFVSGSVAVGSAFVRGPAVHFGIVFFLWDFPPFFCKSCPEHIFSEHCWQTVLGANFCFGPFQEEMLSIFVSCFFSETFSRFSQNLP